MTKKELEYGNVVETREGKKYIFNYIYEKSYFICLNGAGFNPSKYYKNDLSIDDSNRECDIMKVYKDYTCQELLWERKEKPKLTEEEKVILSNDDKKYTYIARDKNNKFYLYEHEPIKSTSRWRYKKIKKV